MSELTLADATVSAASTTPAIQRGAPPANPFYKSPIPPAEPEPTSGFEKEQTNVAEGAISLTWPKELTEDSVAEFEYWVNGLIRQARRKAGLPQQKPKSKPTDDQSGP